MFGKRKLREENIRLKCRIEQLENILCPGGQHGAVVESVDYVPTSYMDCETLRVFKCKRCGKTWKTQSWV